MKKKELKSEVTNKREELKAYLAKKLPTMFDRDPVLTGNLDLLVDEILDF